MTAAFPLLAAQGLGFAVLHDLDLVLGPGLHLVTGGEGRGKTCLLRLLAGELQPARGRIERRAAEVWYEQPADAAHDALVAADWLAARQACHPGWQAATAAALVEAFGLAEHLHKPLYMLSAGSRRKVGLVGAAASGAGLTLLEAPWAALDARSGRVLSELLADAADGTDRAWVLADYAEPPSLADVAWASRTALGD